MIAMQYSFVLPADYDMAIVRERIAVKGKLLDDLPGLAFKAYLHAARGEAADEQRYRVGHVSAPAAGGPGPA